MEQKSLRVKCNHRVGLTHILILIIPKKKNITCDRNDGITD